jgi:hypothetical protein
MRTILAVLVAALVGGAPMAFAQDARIDVHAKEVIASVSRTMTGACIEDVNHEIYGGLYSQMIFGESFQEPVFSPPVAIQGFHAYGGEWMVKGEELWAAAGEGPKLVADRPEIGEGEVGVEVFFPDAAAGNAGLIVKVAEPGEGADKFVGYEVSLDAAGRCARLGRHRRNWEHIQDVPCDVPVGRWIPLEVRMTTKRLEVYVGGKPVLKFQDDLHPLKPGLVGVRTWQRPARFRSLWVETAGAKQALALEAPAGLRADAVSRMWRAVRRGSAAGRFALESPGAFTGTQSQRITFASGQGEMGIENRGLNRWGMCFREGKPCEGYVWLRADKQTDVHVAMESADGATVYAEGRLRASGGDWQRADFTLTPKGTDPAGRFVVSLRAPGSVLVGHAFLQPGEWGRFKGLPVRRDVAEGLVAQGLTVLRYGGSMVNHAEYRWKKMIGPRDRRPPYRGTWYAYSTNGWGIADFISFCEAAGFLGIPAFNMGETPDDMADFMEYANGPAESPWGRRRAEDGHAAPYRLKHVELGNEEAVNEAYWRKFKPMAEAVWAKDPAVILVVGDFAYSKPIADPYAFDGAPGIRSLEAHKKILDLAKEHGREVWFDVHIWNDRPRDPEGLGGIPSFIQALGRISPGATFKVAVFELNAGNHAHRRALANAHAVNELERIGDAVPIVCSANGLQPDRQNDNGWDQGLLFLDPSQVWPQPPYFVTQMISRNYLPKCVKADVQAPADALDVTAKTGDDGKVLALQVVNMEDKAVAARITFDGFAPAKPAARVAELAARPDDVNTAEAPDRVRPAERPWRHELKDGGTSYIFPPNSFTILRFE